MKSQATTVVLIRTIVTTETVCCVRGDRFDKLGLDSSSSFSFSLSTYADPSVSNPSMSNLSKLLNKM